MLRVLLSRRWLAALAAAVLFAVAAFFLGRWQWHRYEGKSARADRINLHYTAPAQPLADVLGTEPMPLARDWTRVTAKGGYDGQKTLLVRNRPWEGTYGYEVLVPLSLDSSQTVLVDRGWVPNADRANELPRVPAAPDGQVTVTGWVRRGEVSLGRKEIRGQLASINLAEASAQLGRPVLGGYVILQSEQTASGSSAARPRPLEQPDTDLGPHQAYALQWWLSMPVFVILVLMGARREHVEGSGAEHTPRPKKVRIWDEEDA